MNKTDELLFLAIDFATKAHRWQMRKISGFPFIAHPIRVGKILALYTENKNLVLAGILHDTLEDTKVTEDDIEKNFWKEVLKFVLSVTENLQANTWKEKKEEYIQLIRKGGEETCLLSIVDKIDNLSSLSFGFDTRGMDIWKYFWKGREDYGWFYYECFKIFQEILQDKKYTPLLAQLEQNIKKLFF